MVAKKQFRTAGHTAATADDGAVPASTKIDPKLVAPNPLNKRRVDADSPAVLDMKKSLESEGQIQASTVVTRTAFLASFPEYNDTIGPQVAYVQLAGAVRRAACLLAGRELEIAVKDEFADSRARWAAATAVENLKRTDLDAMEEADQVALTVQECGGNQSEAARRLGYSQPWVNQRVRLVELAPDAQELIRQHRVPIHEVRTGSLWKLDSAGQVAFVREVVRTREVAITAVIDEPGEQSVPKQRTASKPKVSPVVRAVYRISAAWSKGTPAARTELVAGLRAQMSREERIALAQEISRDDG